MAKTFPEDYGLTTTFPASDPKDITGLVQNVWTRALKSNAKRQYLDIQNTDVTNVLKFFFTNNPFALLFDGTDDLVEIDAIVADPFTTAGHGSITARIKHDASGAADDVIFSASDTSANAYLKLWVDNADNKLKAEIRNATAVQWSIETDAAITQGEYIEVKLVHSFRDNIPQLFINKGGVAQTITTSTDNTFWVDSLSAVLDNARIGCINVNGAGDADFLKGSIDFVRIDAGTGSHVNREVVAIYEIDEGTGATVGDSSPNAFNGTLTSATWEARSNGRQLAKDSGRPFVDNECPQSAVWLLSAAVAHGTVTLREG